jgi:hypothetical protein
LRRAELVAILAVVLGGCMRIYPDPELPDVEVTWFEDDCAPGRGNVTMTLIGLDSETRVPLTVPCSDVKATFADVARERYRFEGFLEDADGEVFARNDSLIDLRDGLDEEVYLYFGSYSNFRVAWRFDMGAACETLEMWVLLTFSHPDGTPAFLSSAPCLLTPFFGQFLAGTYTVQLSAMDESTTVATSPESEPFELFEDELTDIGTMTLSP